MGIFSRKTLFSAAIPVLFLLFCAVFAVSGGLTALALPFTLLGKGLRLLSLSGTVGNIAAIILYLAVALLPLLFKLRKSWNTEDVLLVVCSALLLYVVYYMINPALRPMILQNSVGDLILSGVVYSTLLSWAVIKLLQRCDSMENTDIFRALQIFLAICAAEFGLAIAAEFAACRADIAAIRAANTMPGLDLTPTFTFVYLDFSVTALEYGLVIRMLLLAIKLLRELSTDAYSSACAETAEILSHWCRRSLILVTAACTALQIAQLLFTPSLHDIAVNFRLPAVSMAIAFALLALTRLLRQGRSIKEDNDLFI